MNLIISNACILDLKILQMYCLRGWGINVFNTSRNALDGPPCEDMISSDVQVDGTVSNRVCVGSSMVKVLVTIVGDVLATDREYEGVISIVELHLDALIVG